VGVSRSCSMSRFRRGQMNAENVPNENYATEKTNDKHTEDAHLQRDRCFGDELTNRIPSHGHSRVPTGKPNTQNSGPARQRSFSSLTDAFIPNHGGGVRTRSQTRAMDAFAAQAAAHDQRPSLSTVVEDVHMRPAEPRISAGSTSSVASLRAPTPDCDLEDVDDPQCVAEYVNDIFAYFRSNEQQHLPSPRYMQNQNDINEKMRAILIDWLVEVHLKFKLVPETLYLTVNLIDRFLEKKIVARNRLQLVGVTCMLIASKYEEIYAPEVRDFVYITDKAYTRDEILNMEILILNTLKFHITVPSTLRFLTRYCKISRLDERHTMLAQYLVELSLPDYKMVRYAPSHLAAAALYLSNKIMKKSPAWPNMLVPQTKYTEASIRTCAKEICSLLQNVDKAALQAVKKKFSLPKFQEVAKIAYPDNRDA